MDIPGPSRGRKKFRTEDAIRRRSSSKNKRKESKRKSKTPPNERNKKRVKRRSLKRNVDNYILERTGNVPQRLDAQRDVKKRIMSKIRSNNNEFVEKERIEDRLRKRSVRSQTIPVNERDELLIAQFKQLIKDGPTEICHSCCGRFFKHSMRSMKRQILVSKFENISLLENTKENVYNFCQTCFKSINKGEVPKLCTRDGLQLPDIPDVLKNLNTIEIRLIAPVLPFMQIRELGFSGRQFGIKGNVVNVPIDIKTTIDKLPRSFKDAEVIQLKLKRMLTHKTDYKFEYVRPKRVYDAAKYLSETQLFKDHEIELDLKWIEVYNQDKEDFVINEEDKEEFVDNDQYYELSSQESDEDFIELNDDNPSPGEGETMISKNSLILAPGENRKPISFYSTDCEYLAFPNIYCGSRFNENNPKKLSVSDQAKYKLRYFDRRFAGSVTNLFYCLRHKQIDSIRQGVNTVLKKRDNNHKQLTAGDVLNTQLIDDLIRNDDAFQILTSDRTSPVYWEKRMKELTSMIRQLGDPTLFMTLSAAESQWPELIRILVKIANNRELTIEEFEAMSYKEKYDLIKNDPVTCAQYFDRRFRELFKILLKGLSPFEDNKIIDYFIRTEFQHRGSPHVHCLLWLQNAPKISENNDNTRTIEDFIDKLIRCSTDIQELTDIIHLQTHKHSKSCKRKLFKTTNCRFGFPLFPMRKTVLLKPLFKQNEETTDDSNENSLTGYKIKFDRIKNKLNEIDNWIKENLDIYDFDSFLEDLDMSEEIYIQTICSQIKMTTVFLKRDVKDIRVNAYNPNILRLFQSNMDLQYIVDPYGCVHYIVNYISKSYRGVSRLMKETIKETKKGNSDPRNRLRIVGQTFINSSEISAQEAVYILLSMDLTMCSRQCIFINTGEKEKRTKMIKTKYQLMKLDPESTDIMSKGIIEYYMWRPNELENLCLAEFASKYHVYNSNNSSNEETEDNDIQPVIETVKSKRIRICDPQNPSNILCTLQERKVPKIIRYRRYQLEKEKNQYFREKIMLYKPWRDEEKDILCKDTEKLYLEYENIISENEQMFVKNKTIDYESIRQTLEIQRMEEEVTLDTEAVEFRVFSSLIPSSSLETDIPLKLKGKEEKFLVFRTPNMICNEEYYSLIRSLNVGQRKYLLGLMNLIRNDKIPVYHLITGGAGTGKSQLIRAIYQTLIREFSKDPECSSVDYITVLLTAPTGMAAFNINGSTIHSALGITTNENTNHEMKPLGDEIKNSYRQKLYHLKVIIIDEVSMVGNRMLSKINDRLQQIFDSNLIFGGISILFFGDFNQLRPVKESLIFYPLSSNNLEILAGNCLWDQVKIYRLEEIMRQKDDIPFANALNNLANFSLKNEDINLFTDRIFSDGSQLMDQSIKQLPSNCIHLFQRNEDVNQHNQKIISESPEILITSPAIDILPINLSAIKRDQMMFVIKNLTTEQTMGLPLKVELKKDIRYMITCNTDVNDGLVNGTIGILKRIDCDNNDKPFLLWFDFENIEIGSDARQRFSSKSFDNYTPILRIEKSITRKLGSELITFTRKQFPLKPAQAITIHKSQGQTYNEVVVHLTKGLNITYYYTALSRAKRSEGLFIIGEFSPPDKPTPGNQRIFDEIKRLETESPLKFDTDFEVSENNSLIYYHNFPYLSHHIPDIICDRKVKDSNILIFIETRTNNLMIDGFKLFHQIQYDQKKPNSRPFGIAIYGKPDIESKLIATKVIEFKKIKAHIEMLSFEFRNIRTIVVYFSPNLTKDISLKNLENFINELISQKTLLIGDMNININSKIGLKLTEMLSKYNMAFRLEKNSSSTKSGSQIDVIFSNFDLDNALYYENIITYHKPVFVVV